MKATDKQKRALTRMGVTYDSDITKSEASELIKQELEVREQLDDLEYNIFTDDEPLFDRSFSSDGWKY